MKICFLSLNSYPILTNSNLGYVGGAEVEQTQLGKELATYGYDVCFVTYQQGNSKIEKAGEVEIIKAYDREKASEMNFLSKYRLIWSSLKKAEADIYFHEAGAIGVLPLFCHLNGKRFVYRIPSDAVVLSKSLSGTYSFYRKIVDTLEIKKANIVIAQSNFQRRTLKERFRVESVVIKNGLIVDDAHYEKEDDTPIVLWVGSISSVKRPDLFVELAKSISNIRFEMIGGRIKTDSRLYDRISAKAQKLPNLIFHGFVPFHEVDEYFRKASVFVNTSSVEGFPNTFIQAWAHSTPVVSLSVDPDNIIQNEKLGFCSGAFRQLVSNVTSLLEDEGLRKTMGENARKYVEREHDIRKTVKKYIKVFEEIL